MIPKVFHRIWLGSKIMPEEFVRYGQTWQEHHPDWTMKLWTDSNLPDLSNKNEFLETEILAQKADILRYELILKFGGIYIDVDFVCQKPITPLLENVDAFVAKEEQGVVTNSIFGGIANHPLFNDIVLNLPNSIHLNRNKLILEQSGPYYFSSIVARYPEVKIFEYHYFFPYPCWELWRKNESFPNAYAVHHWAGSWIDEDHRRIRKV